MALPPVFTVNDFVAKDGSVFFDNAASYWDAPSWAGPNEWNSTTVSTTGALTLTGDTTLVSSSTASDIIFSAPKVYVESLFYIWDNGWNSVTFDNSDVNFDKVEWNNTWGNGGPIAFTGTSSINITTASNGKTLIRASTLTGAVSLDIEDDVQDGTTFSIESANNQLIITDLTGWAITPSTVGNVTTYTLAKVGPSIKQRLFYTYENGNRVLRFLRGGL